MPPAIDCCSLSIPLLTSALFGAIVLSIVVVASVVRVDLSSATAAAAAAAVEINK